VDHQHHPQQRKRLPLPQIERDGPRRSLWLNFLSTCSALNRPGPHVAAFISAEIGSNVSVAGESSERLCLSGAFRPKQVAQLLRQYITSYCLCVQCKGV
jgi:translation initiation factor 2 subunit 2